MLKVCFNVYGKRMVIILTAKRVLGFDNVSYTKSGFPVSTALVIVAITDKTDIQPIMSS